MIDIKGKILTKVILGIAVWLWPVPVFGLTSFEGLTKQSDQSFQFDAKAKDSYYFGEPLEIEFSLENKSQRPQIVKLSELKADLEYSAIETSETFSDKVIVRVDSKKSIQIFPNSLKKEILTKTEQINNSDEIVVSAGENIVVKSDLQQWFSYWLEPGNYSLIVDFQNGQKITISFLISLKLEETTQFLKKLILSNNLKDRKLALKWFIQLDETKAHLFFIELSKSTNSQLKEQAVYYLESYFSSKRNKGNDKNSNLQFAIITQKKYLLNEPIFISFSLINLSNKNKAGFEFFTSKIKLELYSKKSFTSKPVGNLHKLEILPSLFFSKVEGKPTSLEGLLLDQHESLVQEVALADLFPGKFDPGDYTLIAFYKNKQKIINRFQVIVDQKETPISLESLIKSNTGTDKVWAARQLVAIDRERTLTFFEEITKTNDIQTVGWVTDFLRRVMTNLETPKDLAEWAKELFEKFKQ